MEKIRSLRADEIEVRVGTVTSKGVQLLLYKDARCDKRILDETFGMFGWSNCYSEVKGNLFCQIMLFDKETGLWFQKTDCGIESNTQKEKGEASDAFKRACFNIGIGRELYSAPFIFVNVPVEETINPRAEKKTYRQKNPYEKWHVVDIQTNAEKEKIEYLKIANDKNEVVFLWGKKTAQEDKPKKETPSTPKPKQEEPDVISEPQRKRLFAIADGNVEAVKKLVKKHGYTSTTEIKKSEYTDMCEELKDMLMIDKEEN